MTSSTPSPETPLPVQIPRRHPVVRAATTGTAVWRTLREIVLGALPIIGVIALTWLVVREVRRADLEVAPISVPSKLADMGLSPEVVAQRLVDQIDAVERAAKSDNSERPATELSGALPDLNVPLAGLSLRSVASLLRNVLGIPPRRVNGEIILQPNDRLALRLRMFGSGQIANIEGFALNDIDNLLALAAPEVWRVTVPQLYAWYVAEHEARQEVVREKLVALRESSKADRSLENTVAFLIARSLVRSGQSAEALAVTDELIRKSPDYAPGWYARALALSDLSRSQDAIEAHRHAMALAPDSSWAHKGAARIFIANGRGADALNELQAARQIDPNDTDLSLLEAAALTLSGHAGEAIATVQHAMDAAPGTSGLHEAMANALLAKGDDEGALKEFDAELEHEPRRVSSLIGRARALLALRRPEEALTSIEVALKIASRHQGAQSVRGFALLQLGRNQEALQLFDKLLAVRSDVSAFLRGRGLALAALGQKDAAMVSLQRALEITPNDRRLRADVARLRGNE